MKNLRRRLAVAFGVLSLGAAVAVWLGMEGRTSSGVGVVAALLAFVFLVLVVASNYVRQSTRGIERGEDRPEPPASVVGGRVENVLEEPSAEERDELVGLLRRAAVESLSGRHGRESARELVSNGGWTDDPRAASLLAEAGEVDLPVGVRLYDWLFESSAFAARAEHVVEELQGDRE